MKRKTLDILFSAGGVVLAALFFVLGLVMVSNYNFSRNYVKTQLLQQQITFKPAAALTPEEAKAACLVKYAGQKLQTGKQAECYANSFIGLHVKNTANGATYATLGDTQTDLKAQIAAAQKTNDPKLADLQTQLTTVNTQRETLFKGETLRGLLLSSYGFSTLGMKGGQAATVSFLAAGLLFILSIAGFIHAFVTPETEAFGAIETEAQAPRATSKPVTA